MNHIMRVWSYHTTNTIDRQQNSGQYVSFFPATALTFVRMVIFLSYCHVIYDARMDIVCTESALLCAPGLWYGYVATATPFHESGMCG